MRRQIPHLHILGHSLPNRCHGKLLWKTEILLTGSFSMLSQCWSGEKLAANLQARRPPLPPCGLVQQALCRVLDYAASECAESSGARRMQSIFRPAARRKI